MAVSLHKNWPSQIVGILGIVMRWIEWANVHMNYENGHYQHEWQLKERARMLWLRITYLPGKKQLKNREKGFLYKTSIQQQLSECLIGGDRYMERKHHLPPYPGWSPYQKTSTKKRRKGCGPEIVSAVRKLNMRHSENKSFSPNSISCTCQNKSEGKSAEK